MDDVRITRRQVWQGPSWSLQALELAFPDGAVVTRGLIDHPGSVLLLPVLDDRLLLVRQYRLALDKEILELPAGTRRPDEAFEACAQRELREETGYRSGALTPLGHLWLAPGLSNEHMALFLAEDLTLDPLPADRDEDIRLQPVSLVEAGRLALAGEIPDAKTALAILRLLSLRGQLVVP